MDHPIFYELTGWHLAVLGLFVATLGALQWGKAFSAGTLGRGPRREVGWGPLEQGMAGVLSVLFALPLVVGGLAPEPPPSVMEALHLVAFMAVWAGIVFMMTRLSRTGQLRLGGVVPRRPGRDVAVALVGVPVAFVLASGLGLLVSLTIMLMGVTPPEHGHVVLETMQDPSTPVSEILLLAVSAVVVAPITEEFFFRGLLQTAIQSVIGHDKRWMSILPVAVFFGVIHLGAVPWAMVPVLVMLGVVFGWVYERTGSLWCAVLVHAGFNATSIAVTLLSAG